MAETSLLAEVRHERGSRASRRLLASGRIPGVLYGHGESPVALSVGGRALRAALSTEAGVNALLDLSIGGEEHLAIVREIQRHPVRQTISHVDFQAVNRDEVVSVEVAVTLVGEARAVSRAGGTVEHLLAAAQVRARPADIPAALEVDVSELEVGDSVLLGQLALPAGVSLDADPGTIVVIAHPPRIQAAEAEGAAEGAAAEGGEES